MLKMTLKTFYVSCLVVSAGVALALASRKPPAELATPAYCQTGGNWLSLATTQPEPAGIQDIVAHAAKQDVVLLGEQHDIEDHHRWQLQMLSALHARRPEMVIGFEMFPRRVQPVLDQWIAGSLSAEERPNGTRYGPSRRTFICPCLNLRGSTKSPCGRSMSIKA